MNQTGDPRGGQGIHLHLNGDWPWPELRRQQFEHAAEISLAAQPKGTEQGHATVVVRFDTKHGRPVLGLVTLRELYNVTRAIVAAYGEDWMKPETADTERRQQFVVNELARQLLEAKARLGEEPMIDMSAADKAYDEASKGE